MGWLIRWRSVFGLQVGILHGFLIWCRLQGLGLQSGIRCCGLKLAGWVGVIICEEARNGRRQGRTITQKLKVMARGN